MKLIQIIEEDEKLSQYEGSFNCFEWYGGRFKIKEKEYELYAIPINQSPLEYIFQREKSVYVYIEFRRYNMLLVNEKYQDRLLQMKEMTMKEIVKRIDMELVDEIENQIIEFKDMYIKDLK